ncbi:hypothetical protein L2E82_26022 [Cichorium intybus]|uniref:Uncharacterized protein n=1 Tax=Cichorium intybus TaxID=13427 RepID=A0ACB9E659_CICIN|nr:hypothetical protein L2E82_26022 [Cichorium intybus]
MRLGVDYGRRQRDVCFYGRVVVLSILYWLIRRKAHMERAQQGIPIFGYFRIWGAAVLERGTVNANFTDQGSKSDFSSTLLLRICFRFRERKKLVSKWHLL